MFLINKLINKYKKLLLIGDHLKQSLGINVLCVWPCFLYAYCAILGDVNWGGVLNVGGGMR
jgi:hypothetical protein